MVTPSYASDTQWIWITRCFKSVVRSARSQLQIWATLWNSDVLLEKFSGTLNLEKRRHCIYTWVLLEDSGVSVRKKCPGPLSPGKVPCFFLSKLFLPKVYIVGCTCLYITDSTSLDSKTISVLQRCPSGLSRHPCKQGFCLHPTTKQEKQVCKRQEE